MTGTETIPLFKPQFSPVEWVGEVFGRPEQEYDDIQSGTTKFDDVTYHRVRPTNLKLDVESNLWQSLVKSHVKFGGLVDLYFTLLQRQYQDPVEDTSCTFLPQRMAGIIEILRPAVAIMPLEKYMDQLTTTGIISYEVKDTASRIWEMLQEAFPHLREPDAAPSGDFGLMLAFDDGLNHLEFEFLEKNYTEVYFLKRDTNETWEMELIGSDSLPQLLLDKVRLFLK